MKSKILLLGAVIAVFTSTSFAADALLSPRAQGNQIKVVASSVNIQASTASYVASASPALLSPRATGNQITKIAGADSDFNPALACRNGWPEVRRLWLNVVPTQQCRAARQSHRNNNLANHQFINRVVPA